MTAGVGGAVTLPGIPVVRAGDEFGLTVGDDAVAFVRESAVESVLVFASRSAAELEVAADALGAVGVPDAATAHYGDARLEASARLLALSADGPTFAVWQLDAVASPAW